MAQAGIHGIVGTVVRKWFPEKKLLLLGIVLGNLFPDTDNFAVAVATLTGGSTVGLHRTFTHSLITVAVLIAVFYLAGWIAKKPHWGYLGVGLGIGIVMHIFIDLIIWFNGIELLWPLPSWVNFWENVTVPEWWKDLMMPLEFLFFALYFLLLANLVRKQNTDSNHLKKLRIHTLIQVVFLVVFTALLYTLSEGFMTVYGAVYLLSLVIAFVLSIQMRETLETV